LESWKEWMTRLMEMSSGHRKIFEIDAAFYQHLTSIFLIFHWFLKRKLSIEVTAIVEIGLLIRPLPKITQGNNFKILLQLNWTNKHRTSNPTF